MRLDVCVSTGVSGGGGEYLVLTLILFDVTLDGLVETEMSWGINTNKQWLLCAQTVKHCFFT